MSDFAKGTNVPTNDCISRQAVIEAVGYYSLHSGDKLLFADKPLKDLPSAQSGIVRCKDCKHYEIYQLKKDGTDDRRYKPSYCTLLRHNFKPDWYCADGERRENEQTDRC